MTEPAYKGHSVNLDDVLRPSEAAKVVGTPEGTLRYWRSSNQGPPWFRLSKRSIRYLRSDCEQWVRDQMAASYVDPGAADLGPLP